MMNKQDDLHPEDRRNLILFIISAAAVWLIFDHFVIQPRVERTRAAQAIQATQTKDTVATPVALKPRTEIIAQTPRLKIENSVVFGSINLKGGRLDDLSLKKYFKKLNGAENVVLLSPPGALHTRYVEFGWVPAQGTGQRVPGPDTLWQAEGNSRLAPGSPVTLSWSNGQGLRFENRFEIDDVYMLHVSQRVTNTSSRSVTLYPYALVSQTGLPEDFYGHSVVHEGPLAYLDGKLIEHPYVKLREKPEDIVPAVTGWIGLSDKYWFTSLVPDQETEKKFRTLYVPKQDAKEKKPEDYGRFQTDYTGAAMAIAPGQSAESATNVFSGAKEIRRLAFYEQSLKVRHFDLAVDFGLYYFMTKPFFYILDFFARITGNFGIAIIGLTIVVRLAVFPLANASFRSFAKMKKIGPEMRVLREKYGTDKEKLQESLVALYEKEKVNPMAGCLPIFIQIPIFFALYKVFSVTIEMRHAPFFGWIHDLSAQDPTTIFNLFGLIDWQPPSQLMIGGWSCFMLIAMLVQRNLSPTSQDPSQAMATKIMPFFITFILSKFPAGLVIYWTFSNTFSVLQQYVLMRSMGIKVSLFHATDDEKEMEELVEEGPDVHPGLEMVESRVEDALFGTEDGKDQGKKVSAPRPKKKKKR